MLKKPAALLLLTLAAAARAQTPAPPAIPDNAIKTGSTALVVLDVSKLTRDAAAQSYDAITQTLALPKNNAQRDALLTIADKIQAAGADRLVVSAHANWNPTTTAPATAPATTSASAQASSVWIHLRPGATAPQFLAALKPLKDALLAAGATDEGTTDLAAYHAQEMPDHWIALTGPDLDDPAKPAAAADERAPLLRALEPDAAFQAILLFDRQSRQAMAQAAMNPFAAMFAGPLLTSLQHADGLAFAADLGPKPALRISATFESDADARALRDAAAASLTSAGMLLGGLDMLGGDKDPLQAKQTQQLQSLLAALTPDQKGPRATITLDLSTLEKFHALELTQNQLKAQAATQPAASQP
jgi:hypothetical protein